jgi:hypothetical protein
MRIEEGQITQKKHDKGTNNDILFKALYRKLKIEQHETQ